MPNKGLPIVFIFVASLAYAADVEPLSRSYSKVVSGFFHGHFSRSTDISSKAGNSACADFDGNILRGGEPAVNSSTVWLDHLLDNQVALVVDLRNENSAQKERDALVAKNITYVKLPLRTEGSDQLPTMTVIEARPGEAVVTTKFARVDATLHVLGIVQEFLKHNQRVYLHCQRGEDRTGTFVRLLRNCPGASSEFYSYGGTLYPALKKHLADVSKSLATLPKTVPQ